MNPGNQFEWDFNFGGESRATLLDEATTTLKAVDLEMGDGTKGVGADPARQAAADLLGQLSRHVAEFGHNPPFLELKEKHFALYGWQVPRRFRDLSRDHRFFYLGVPVLLKQLENLPFRKLELGLEFNPGEAAGHLRPTGVMIFPNKQLKQLIHFDQGATLKIGENFDFAVATGPLDLTVADAEARLDAGIEAGAGGGFSLAIGPFSYDIRKVEVDHSPLENEKVFWSVNSGKYLQEKTPAFVVVVQVPKAADNLQIAAAMQAYHHLNLAGAGLRDILNYTREKVANFLRSGAPIQDTTVWDMTPKL